MYSYNTLSTSPTIQQLSDMPYERKETTNHQHLDVSFNIFDSPTAKNDKNSVLLVPCADGCPAWWCGFPTQMASNVAFFHGLTSSLFLEQNANWQFSSDVLQVCAWRHFSSWLQAFRLSQVSNRTVVVNSTQTDILVYRRLSFFHIPFPDNKKSLCSHQIHCISGNFLSAHWIKISCRHMAT